METKTFMSIDCQGEWGGSTYHVRSDGTIIEEIKSRIQGSLSGARHLYPCPPDILAAAQRELMGELSDDEPDTRALLLDWSINRQPLPQILRVGGCVQ